MFTFGNVDSKWLVLVDIILGFYGIYEVMCHLRKILWFGLTFDMV